MSTDKFEDPNRRGVYVDKKKLSVVRCVDCDKPLMMAVQCKSCAIKSGHFIEPKKAK